MQNHLQRLVGSQNYIHEIKLMSYFSSTIWLRKVSPCLSRTCIRYMGSVKCTLHLTHGSKPSMTLSPFPTFHVIPLPTTPKEDVTAFHMMDVLEAHLLGNKIQSSRVRGNIYFVGTTTFQRLSIERIHHPTLAAKIFTNRLSSFSPNHPRILEVQYYPIEPNIEPHLLWILLRENNNKFLEWIQWSLLVPMYVLSSKPKWPRVGT